MFRNFLRSLSYIFCALCSVAFVKADVVPADNVSSSVASPPPSPTTTATVAATPAVDPAAVAASPAVTTPQTTATTSTPPVDPAAVAASPAVTTPPVDPAAAATPPPATPTSPVVGGVSDISAASLSIINKQNMFSGDEELKAPSIDLPSSTPYSPPEEQTQVLHTIVNITQADVSDKKKDVDDLFVEHEYVMLFLHDDDVVLGELTEDAMNELRTPGEHIKLFWDQFDADVEKEYPGKYDVSILSSKARDTKLLPEDFNLPKELFVTIMDGNVSDMATLLKVKDAINTKDKYGNNLLAIAAIYNRMDLCAYLIEKGLSPYAVNKDGLSAIDIADITHNQKLKNFLSNAKIT